MSYPDLALGNHAGFARQLTAGAHLQGDGGHDATPLILPLLSFQSQGMGQQVVGCRARFPSG